MSLTHSVVVTNGDKICCIAFFSGRFPYNFMEKSLTPGDAQKLITQGPSTGTFDVSGLYKFTCISYITKRKMTGKHVFCLCVQGVYMYLLWSIAWGKYRQEDLTVCICVCFFPVPLALPSLCAVLGCLHWAWTLEEFPFQGAPCYNLRLFPIAATLAMHSWALSNSLLLSPPACASQRWWSQ